MLPDDLGTYLLRPLIWLFLLLETDAQPIYTVIGMRGEELPREWGEVGRWWGRGPGEGRSWGGGGGGGVGWVINNL